MKNKILQSEMKMDRTFYWYNIYLKGEIVETDEDYWTLQPTKKASLLYSIITPFVCFLGICGNLVCLIVLLRRELKASIFTYLSVMATADLLKCIGIFFSGISSVLWDNFNEEGGLAFLDALIASPLGGIISSVSTIATVAVSLDRAVYLWNPTAGVKPKFCEKNVARKIMLISVFVSIVFNLPYCFIFKLDDNGNIVATEFFHSEYYAFHNWLGFILFGIIPVVILTVVNTMLIVAIKKAWKLRSQCRHQCGKMKSDRAFWDQVYLTMTLVAVVFLFLIGEIPLHLLSRRSAITFVYDTNVCACENTTAFVNTLREVCIILSALHVSVNFILYCAFCPPFMRTLKKMFTSSKSDSKKSKKKTKQISQKKQPACIIKKPIDGNVFALTNNLNENVLMQNLQLQLQVQVQEEEDYCSSLTSLSSSSNSSFTSSSISTPTSTFQQQQQQPNNNNNINNGFIIINNDLNKY